MDDGFHSPTPAGTKAVDGSPECRSTVEDVAFIREDNLTVLLSLRVHSIFILYDLLLDSVVLTKCRLPLPKLDVYWYVCIELSSYHLSFSITPPSPVLSPSQQGQCKAKNEAWRTERQREDDESGGTRDRAYKCGRRQNLSDETADFPYSLFEPEPDRVDDWI